jgi:hypothetical protein
VRRKRRDNVRQSPLAHVKISTGRRYAGKKGLAECLCARGESARTMWSCVGCAAARVACAPAGIPMGCAGRVAACCIIAWFKIQYKRTLDESGGAKPWEPMRAP